MVYDCVIIGAGWAGVVAARSLVSAGKSVLLLEARDRVGGRACTYTDGYLEGNPARNIARQMQITANVAQTTLSALYGPAGRIDDAETQYLQRSVAKAFDSVHSASQGYCVTPNQTLQQKLFAQPSMDSDSARALAHTAEVGLGATLDKLSLQWAGWENPFRGSDAAPLGGFQPLISSIVSQIVKGGCEVKLESRVTSIRQTSASIQIQVASQDVFEGRSTLCTIPLGVLKGPQAPVFEPQLPARRQWLIEDVHVGTLEKLVLAYEDAWWPDAATHGSFIFLPSIAPSTHPTESLDILNASTIVVASFAAPTFSSPHPTLLFYLSVTQATALSQYTDAEVSNAAHQFLLARMNVQPDAAHLPKTSVRTSWAQDPYSCGATTTPSIDKPGRSPFDFVELGQPLWNGSLGFAGEHTDPNHRGSIAGAIISGEREATRIEKLLDARS